MATYSGTIDLRVTGNALKETDLINKRINEIRALTKSLKPAPNLFDKRANERIVKAKEELKKLVGEYGRGIRGGRKFANTLAGLNSQIAAFGKIIGNVNTNSDEFVQAITAQEKASRRLARAEADRLRVQTQVNTANTVGRATSVQETLDLGKVIPKSIAGLDLYQRELEETLRNVRIGSQDYRDLSLAIADVNRQLAIARGQGPVQGPALPPGFNERGRIPSPGRRGSRFQDIATGAGFPLLFGGGPFQALAGGIGGAVGGLGGSIAGSAIASQVEAFGRQIAAVGQALNPLTLDLEAVSTAAGIAGTETAQLLQKIEQYGSATEAARLATALLESKIGKGGVKALKDFGKSAQDLGNSLSVIFTKVLSNIAKIAGPLLNKLAQMAGNAETRQAFQSAEGLTGVEAAVQEFFAPGRTQGGAAKKRANKLRSTLTAAGIEVGAGPAGLKAAAEKIRMEAGQRIQAAPQLEIEEIAGGIQTSEDKKAQSEAIRIGQLGEKAALQERLLVLDQRIADAVLKEDAGTKALLEKEKIRETLATKISNIKQSDASQALKDVQIKLAEGEAARKLQDIDIKTGQTESDKAKKVQETVKSLENEGALLEAKLNGTEQEVELKQKIAEATEGMGEKDAQRVEDLIRGNAALKEQVRISEQMDKVYENIGMSIKTGVVDAISAAVDGTKSLAEVASNTLNRIANQLLDIGVNLALFGVPFGTGSGKGLLGGFYANGGRPPVGRPSVVGERGPELFVPRSSGTIVPNHALGGSANVTVNVDASGSSVEGSGNEAAQLGKAIGAAVQQELIKQKRPGGLLAV